MASPLAAFLPEDLEPDYEAIRKLIEIGRPDMALTELHLFLDDRPNDADLMNLIGYANRKLGRFGPSRQFYDRALAIDPNHLGALEYLGELEIQTGNLPQALAIRAKLAELCPQRCHELEELDEALAQVSSDP